VFGVELLILGSVAGYLIVWFITTIMLTKVTYKTALEEQYVAPKRPSKNSRDYTIEELEANETERRKKLAAKSIVSAAIMSLFWPVIWVISLFVWIFGLFGEIVHKFAISPLEAEREKELAYSKAKRIVVKYEEEQRIKFENDLKEINRG
jgi:hypothetical protein